MSLVKQFNLEAAEKPKAIQSFAQRRQKFITAVDKQLAGVLDAGDDNILITLPTGHSVTATTNTNSDDNVQTIFVARGNVVPNGVVITSGNSDVPSHTPYPYLGGGGLEISAATRVDVSGRIIAGNITSGWGGGILNDCELTGTSVYLAGNTGAGGAIANMGTTSFTNTTIEGNTGPAYGVVFAEGAAVFVNSTIVGNQSGWGPFLGDIFDAGGGISVFHSTITGNSGGIVSAPEGAGALMQNSLVLGNAGPGALSATDALGNDRSADYPGLITDAVSLPDLGAF
ncbi:hypothetical protein A9Q94_02015 [Rhodobacterales bacterium 56_14_T64]|nr:hypothetical protein A9Q94_02015 [Rhodobacterales bacterium 56_14_T64]